MIICSCNVVSDRRIKECVQNEGVCTFRQLCRKTKVATQCGICAKSAKEIFDAELAAKKATEVEPKK